MEELLEKISEELKIDKSQWIPTKFGDVAIQQKGKVDRDNTDLTRYVQGGHMNSEDLHLRSWGELEGEYLGPAFIRRFEEGDILYGSRRTYLRKVVIAPFSGITSNTTFVIRANEKNIDKRLLPFIMMTEGFTENSVRNSKGSVNPYINWKDIAKYEFLLPPKDQQAQLAKLLWAMDDVIERKIELKSVANVQYEVAKSNLVLEGLNNETTYSEKIKREVAKRWNITTIGDLLEKEVIIKVQDGNHGEIHPKSADYEDEGIPFIMANTLIDGEIDFNKSKKLPQSITDKLRIGFSYPNDILLSHKGTVGEVAIVPDKIDYPYLMLTPQVTLYRIDESKLKHKFLYYVFNSSYFQNQILRLSTQSTRAYVGITSQRGFKLAIPDSLVDQEKIIEVLFGIEKNRKLIDDSIESSQSLKKSLINQIF